nr:MAG TPA: hypothetical protein [Caudoviricetes sp.]
MILGEYFCLPDFRAKPHIGTVVTDLEIFVLFHIEVFLGDRPREIFVLFAAANDVSGQMIDEALEKRKAVFFLLCECPVFCQILFFYLIHGAVQSLNQKDRIERERVFAGSTHCRHLFGDIGGDLFRTTFTVLVADREYLQTHKAFNEFVHTVCVRLPRIQQFPRQILP